MGNMRPFQIILIGIFLALGVGGLLFFAFFRGFNQEENPYGTSVVIWGTLDDAPFVEILERLAEGNDHFKVVSYVQKDPRTFDDTLVNALAEGTGPDMIVLSHDMLVSGRTKIAPIPFSQFPVRTFKDSYIEGTEVFMLSDGIYALPLAVDPLVMYWNRDIFSSSGLATPPKTWEELVEVTVPRIAQKTFANDVTRAALAFGEYNNVRNAKDILSLLFIQAGSNMVSVGPDGRLSAELNRSTTPGLPPAQAGLDFFVQFSNPTRSVYTWNRGLPQDREEFLAGDLALYFGYASEGKEISEGNPNLNFDVAEVPQSATTKTKKGYGTLYGLALMRNSKNFNGAVQALYAVSAQAETEAYAARAQLGNVYKASHAYEPSDPFLVIVEKAALIARGWLDPDTRASDNIFKIMVEDTVSGKRESANAISDAVQRLDQALNK